MRNQPATPRRVVIAAILLVAVIAVGTVGYVWIEGWSWFDSLYMTVLTVSTTGESGPRPLSAAGRILTMLLIIFGFGVLAYSLLALVGYVLEGQFGIEVELQRMRRRVAAMHDHFILCGFGRVGGEIARAFARENTPFVVVDLSAESVARAAAEGYAVVTGNAADIAVLKEAGIEQARGLITAVDSDPDNVYVTLSARVLRPDLFIVARANRSDSEPKLRLAGANRTISPYTIGGRRMASLAMRPAAAEFVETVMSAGTSELQLEDLTIRANSPWAGRPLSALAGESEEAIVLAIRRGEAMIFRPAPDTELQPGDELVAAGPRQALLNLETRL